MFYQETLDQYKSSPDKSPVSDFDLMNGITSTPRDKKLNYSTFPRAQLGSPDGMGKLDRQINRWMNGCIERQVDKQMDGWPE